MIDSLLHIDRSLFLVFNRDIANPAFDIFFVTITNGRSWIVPVAIAAIFYVRAEKRKALLVILLSLITVAFSDQIAVSLIKPLVSRPRPCNPKALVDGGRFLLGYKTSFSFPSAHACNIFAQATLFTLLYRKYRFYFLSFAALIAFSRVYVGVHYPIDVVGGMIVGIIVGLLVYFGYQYVARQYSNRAADV